MVLVVGDSHADRTWEALALRYPDSNVELASKHGMHLHLEDEEALAGILEAVRASEADVVVVSVYWWFDGHGVKDWEPLIRRVTQAAADAGHLSREGSLHRHEFLMRTDAVYSAAFARLR